MLSEECSQLEEALRNAGEPGRALRLELLKQFGHLVQRLSSSLASELPAAAPKGEVLEAESTPHPLVPPANDAAERVRRLNFAAPGAC